MRVAGTARAETFDLLLGDAACSARAAGTTCTARAAGTTCAARAAGTARAANMRTAAAAGLACTAGTADRRTAAATGLACTARTAGFACAAATARTRGASGVVAATGDVVIRRYAEAGEALEAGFARIVAVTGTSFGASDAIVADEPGILRQGSEITYAC